MKVDPYCLFKFIIFNYLCEHRHAAIELEALDFMIKFERHINVCWRYSLEDLISSARGYAIIFNSVKKSVASLLECFS